jgi:Fibronectin type III domain
MMRLPQRIGYWSAGLALVLVATLLGISGHGLPALGVHMLNGEAWLSNIHNRSVSLIDGYSGKVGSQVGVPAGMGGNLQVVNGPGGAVVTDQNGHIVKVGNADFATTTPITLFGGAGTTAAAGQNALYAIDLTGGKIQQLSASSPKLAKVGPPISVGRPITSPVVAPDGSLYFAIPGSGGIGHVVHGGLLTIKGAGRPNDRLGVVLAGTLPVAADLSTGTVVRLSPTGVSGPPAHLPRGIRAAHVTGSDTDNGLVGVVGGTTVGTVNAITGATTTTRLAAPVDASQLAMQGHNIVLINKARRDVLVVDTPAHRLLWTLTMPHGQVPDGLTVRDRLVFVNDSQGKSALVINGDAKPRIVTKYTGPPPQRQRTKVPVRTPSRSQGHLGHPKPPGAPQNPVATAGKASATVGWRPAAANGSAISAYIVSWTGSDGSRGQQAVGGSTLGTDVGSLSNGVRYTFTIVARNALGDGPGARTASVTPSSSIPDAPAGVTATASGSDAVTLRWTAADRGFHIGSYTIWQVGSTVPLRQNVSGTSVTLGSADNLTVGTPVQFQVQAVGTSGASGPKSAPSAPVTPYGPPGPPTVSTPQAASSGTSATFTVSCPTTCQNGQAPKSYQVVLNPAAGPVSPVAAAPDGSAVTVTLTGLSQNTPYTASVSVTDKAGIPGTSPAVVPFKTLGPPTVSGLGASGVNSASSPTLSVSATVDSGGLPTTCTVTVNGAATADTSCGAISVGTPLFYTSYGVTFTATNADGTSSASGSGRSGLKILTADATTAFGTCPASNPPPFCGGNSHMEPTPNFVANNGAPLVMQGTQELAGCWTTGGVDHGNVSPYNAGSTSWVHMPGAGYMSVLWFPNPNGVTAGLPKASSC